MNLLFLDTETTDCEPNARLVQLAYKNAETGEVVSEYFKPPMPISYEAMSIHHITNEAVATCLPFADSPTQQKLTRDLQKNILVAHNADFDVMILRNEGLTIKKYLDTLNLSRHLIKSPFHKLQYLRYALKLPVESGRAHDAVGDIIVLEALFWHLKKLLAEKFNSRDDEEIIDKMFELNQTPILLENIGFGKYRGQPFAQIAKNDHNYLEWLFNSELLKNIDEQNRDLVYTLKYYL